MRLYATLHFTKPLVLILQVALVMEDYRWRCAVLCTSDYLDRHVYQYLKVDAVKNHLPNCFEELLYKILLEELLYKITSKLFSQLFESPAQHYMGKQKRSQIE